MAEDRVLLPKVDINVPRWDQSTYMGRAKYFFTTTNPMNIFKTNDELIKAKLIIDKYKQGQPLAGLSLEDVYKAKDIVDSAFHPDTGEKMILVGRMSAQVPMNMLITGCMITFYKSTPAVVFWQWFNQSFNAIVNYTNRSGNSPMPTEQLAKSYVAATSGALVTALSLNKMLKNAPSIFGRLVPFMAVAAANCINIPELNEGIEVYDENNQLVGQSNKAAYIGISTVVFSRIAMCSPGMLLTPIAVEWAEKKPFLRKYPKMSCPLQILLCGLFLTFATPMCCAIFPQKSSIKIESVEPHIRSKAEELKVKGEHVYYNKGL